MEDPFDLSRCHFVTMTRSLKLSQILSILGTTCTIVVFSSRMNLLHRWICSCRIEIFYSWKCRLVEKPNPNPQIFEECNMENISPTIQIDISMKPGIIENITVGASCSLEELTAYTTFFQEFHDVFAWTYTKMIGLYPSIIEHRIDKWHDVSFVC